MFDIDWSMKAYRQLAKIRDKQTLATIRAAVSNLRSWPDCRNVKALSGHQYGYRLRVGRFRILFDVQEAVRIIAIQEVKKRDERTY